MLLETNSFKEYFHVLDRKECLKKYINILLFKT